MPRAQSSPISANQPSTPIRHESNGKLPLLVYCIYAAPGTTGNKILILRIQLKHADIVVYVKSVFNDFSIYKRQVAML